MSTRFAKLALPFPSDIPYDNWVSALAELLGVQKIIDEPLQVYRRHGDNTTHSIFARKNPTTIDLIQVHGLADPRAGWESHISVFEAYARRIVERRNLAESLAGPAQVERALGEVRSEEERSGCRLALLTRPRIKRAIPVLRTWMSGGYDDFAGWKSAAKDLIRR
jgi:hypothetical protein